MRDAESGNSIAEFAPRKALPTMGRSVGRRHGNTMPACLRPVAQSQAVTSTTRQSCARARIADRLDLGIEITCLNDRVGFPLKRSSCGHHGHRRCVMGLSEFDPAARERVSWKAGRKVGAKRALKPRQIWAIRFFLDKYGQARDRALFDLASIASCADVIWSRSGSAISSAIGKFGPRLQLCSKRPANQFS